MEGNKRGLSGERRLNRQFGTSNRVGGNSAGGGNLITNTVVNVNLSPQPGPSRGRYHGVNRGLFTQQPGGATLNLGQQIDISVPNTQENLKIALQGVLPEYNYYYPDDPPKLPEPLTKISAVEHFLARLGIANDQRNVICKYNRKTNEENAFMICYDDVIKDEEFLKEWPNFEMCLMNDPEETIQLWSATADMFIRKSYIVRNNHFGGGDDTNDTNEPVRIMKFRIGFFKSAPVVPMINLSTSYVGKFVTITGAVTSAESIKPYITRLAFKCKVCEENFNYEQKSGYCTLPIVCGASKDCKNKTGFGANEKSFSTLYVDSRRIRIQDLNNENNERNAVPKATNCLLLGGWVNHVSTGDSVIISGVYKIGVQPGRTKHEPYILVSAVQQQKDSEQNVALNALKTTEDDNELIRKIHAEPQLFRLLCASLCPSIYGLDMVKAGLLLCVFGGTEMADKLAHRRSDINLLMVGDPGIGKSILLKAVKEVAPKSAFVCGTNTTVAGLTVTLSKDGDDYCLDVGAVVIADQGICLIDEFDKMSNYHHALLEALEQQCVSVAKCGVQRTLSARTTVVAAANPAGGSYNKTKTMVENIKIKPAVLSRFDLIFLMLDIPDPKRDERLVIHGGNLRMGQTGSGGLAATPPPPASPPNTTNIESMSFSSYNPDSALLHDRLRVKWGEIMDLIPSQLIRKYVAYAKEHVKPRLSPAAMLVLKNFYLKLRRERKQDNSTIPVTARQLESLKRLAEARSKLELREVVTEQDAKDVVEIFQYSMNSCIGHQPGLPETILLDSLLNNSISNQPGPSKPRSIKTQAKHLFKALQDEVRKENRNVLSMDEMKMIIKKLGFVENTDILISTLNDSGYILLQGSGYYRIILSTF